MWLNLAVRLFAALTEKQLRRGVHRSTREIKDAIYAYVDSTNKNPKPFIWTKTADEILASVARFCLNEVKDRKLVYDVSTASGRSGGPVFGPKGTLIGVNFAITRNLGDSNFGVPIRFARALLPSRVTTSSWGDNEGMGHSTRSLGSGSVGEHL